MSASATRSRSVGARPLAPHVDDGGEQPTQVGNRHGCEVVDALGAGRFRRAEDGADRRRVGSSALDLCGSLVEVKVVPRKTENFADAQSWQNSNVIAAPSRIVEAWRTRGR